MLSLQWAVCLSVSPSLLPAFIPQVRTQSICLHVSKYCLLLNVTYSWACLWNIIKGTASATVLQALWGNRWCSGHLQSSSFEPSMMLVKVEAHKLCDELGIANIKQCVSNTTHTCTAVCQWGIKGAWGSLLGMREVLRWQVLAFMWFSFPSLGQNTQGNQLETRKGSFVPSFRGSPRDRLSPLIWATTGTQGVRESGLFAWWKQWKRPWSWLSRSKLAAFKKNILKSDMFLPQLTLVSIPENILYALYNVCMYIQFVCDFF